jgi:ATP-binding protein involved in chromosome partitioning
MFRNKDINIPILGLVENMAWFTPAELPENKYYIFGKEGGVKMAQQLGIDLLAQIPIYMSIRENCDLGTPQAIQEWDDLAQEVIKRS